MKNKKIIPIIILSATVLTMAVYLIINSIALKPTVTEGEFPFSITYELDGETVTIKDVYKVYYDGNDGYADTKSRVYVGTDEMTTYTIKREGNTRIELFTHFYPDYMMGDSEYDYFEDGDTFEPRAYYYDEYEQESSDSETLLAHGFKLISYEYPTPIENSFVFSHLSYFSGEIVLPLLLICLVALIATLIAVKKEKDLRYNAVDVISIILNFAVSILLVPFTALVGMLIDIEGGGPELYHQLAYFISPISMLSVVCSIALRRKGNRISSLIATLVGPVAFALYLLIFGVLLML